jgi:hypothetical protein
MDIERQELDLEIYRGDTISKTLTAVDSSGSDVSLVGFSGNAQIKRHKDGDVIAEFTVEIDGETITITLDTSEEGYDLGPDGTGVWDLQVNDGTHRYTTHAGIVTYVEDVTVANDI